MRTCPSVVVALSENVTATRSEADPPTMKMAMAS